MSEAPRPTGLIANKGIELLTWPTSNGHKASIMLEELKEAYGKDYVFQGINISQDIQKEPWFTKLGPNGRIPVLVDHDKGGFAVMEGLAILTYLARNYDPEYRFWFEDPLEQSTCEQWLAWQHGGLGPMQGQAHHFYRFAKERHAYPTQRYVGETERLYGVLDARLAERDYLAGPGRGSYSIADIANWAWINRAAMIDIDLAARFPNVWRWFEHLLARPAVDRGAQVPGGRPSPMAYMSFAQRRRDEPEAFEEKEGPLKAAWEKARKEYNYVYKSP